MADASAEQFGKNDQTDANRKSHGTRMLPWLIIAAVLGSPIWLPVSLGVVVLIFGMVIMMAALVVLLVVIGGSLILTLLTMGLWLIFKMTSDWVMGMLGIGTLCLAVGVTLLLIPALKNVSVWLFDWTKRVSISLYQKVIKRNKAEQGRDRHA